MGFNIVAYFYDLVKFIVFQQKLEAAENHFLTKIDETNTVLIIGGGSGAFLIKLLQFNNPQKVVYIDISSKMINLSQKRVMKYCPQHLSKVDFRIGSLNTIIPTEKFDTICTNYFLNFFNDSELYQIFDKIDSVISARGKWHFADFNNSTNFYDKFLLKSLYIFFRVTCNIKTTEIPDYRFFFNKFGYYEEFQKSFYDNLITSKIYCK